MRMRKVLWLALPLIAVVGIAVGVLAACVKSGDWTSAFLLEPNELVGAVPSSARAPRAKSAETAPSAAPEAAGAPPGTPPRKWQPNKS